MDVLGTTSQESYPNAADPKARGTGASALTSDSELGTWGL